MGCSNVCGTVLVAASLQSMFDSPCSEGLAVQQNVVDLEQMDECATEKHMMQTPAALAFHQDFGPPIPPPFYPKICR